MVLILCHIVITDFNPVLVATSSFTFFLLLPKQYLYWNTPQSWSSWNYPSDEPSYAWNGFRTRELCLFYSGDAICPRLISDRAMLNVSTISPCTGLQNWEPWCIGKMVWRSFGILNFLPLYISEHVLKSWWKPRLPSQDLYMTNNLDCNWSRTHGNTSSCLQNKLNAHFTPEVMVGSKNNCQLTKGISNILTCGIAYLVLTPFFLKK
jgi:hypothetical protein